MECLPAELTAEASAIKLFNKWTYEEIEIKDISLIDYVQVHHPVYLPHTAGRYQMKRFRKAQCPIVERLTNSLMMHGRNNGKKLMTVRIVKHAFEIIHLLTDANPIQILVDAIINTGPREDSTRIGSAGTVRRQAVDVSPLRRVNQAIWLLTTGVILTSSLIFSRHVRLRSETLRRSQSVLLMSSSMLPRDLAILMPSRRRMSLSVLPSPTDKCVFEYNPFVEKFSLYSKVFACLEPN